MYGLMEGIRAGGSDARAAQEMEMRRAAEQRALQELAMRQESHRAQMQLSDMQRQEYGLRMKQHQDEAAAMQGLTGLADQEGQYNQMLREGGVGMIAPVGERDTLNAMQRVAIARRDPNMLMGLREKGKDLDVSEEALRLSKDPEFQKRALDYISTNDMLPMKYVAGRRDKNGKQLESDRIEFDDGYKHELKAGDLQRIAHGAALAKFGKVQESSKVFGEVSKELQTAIDRVNNRTIGMGEGNSKAQDRFEDNKRKDEELGLRRQQLGLMAGGKPREPDPKLVAQFNTLAAQYAEALDAGDKTKAQNLQKQMAITQAQIDTSANRQTRVGMPKERPETTPLQQAQAYKAYVESGMSPEEARAAVTGVDVGALIRDAVIKAAEAKARGGTPGAAAPTRPATPAGAKLETTTTPQGKTVYRYAGQDRWFPSSTEAMIALGAPRAQEPLGLMGVDPGY